MSHTRRHNPYADPYDESGAWGRRTEVEGTTAMTRDPVTKQERPGFYSESMGAPAVSQDVEIEPGVTTSPHMAAILRSDERNEIALRQYFEQLAQQMTPASEAWGPQAAFLQEQYEQEQATGERAGRQEEANIAKTEAEAEGARQGDPTKQIRQKQLGDENLQTQVLDEAQATGNMGKLTDPTTGKLDPMAMEKAKARLRAGLPAFEGEDIVTPTQDVDPQQQQQQPPPQQAGGGPLETLGLAGPEGVFAGSRPQAKRNWPIRQVNR